MVTSPIGVIGLGLVGTELVNRLTAAGFSCVGYDIDKAACDRARGLGASIVGSSSEVGKNAPCVILSLPNSDIVEEAVEGKTGLIHSLATGHLVIDTTTSDPERCAQLAARLTEHGIDFLDATILGSSRTVANGSCLAMVGGQSGTLERGREILEAFAGQIYHLGLNGKGAEAKLIVNLVLGLNRLVLAEGLLLGKKAGVDLSTLLHVLKDGAAYSKIMDHKGEKMITESFEPEARLAQHLKDVGLILDMGMKQDLKLPLSALHAQILRSGVEAGYADLDNSAVIKALDHYTQKS